MMGRKTWGICQFSFSFPFSAELCYSSNLKFVFQCQRDQGCDKTVGEDYCMITNIKDSKDDEGHCGDVGDCFSVVVVVVLELKRS